MDRSIPPGAIGASIDIGSNTIRLLVVRLADGGVERLHDCGEFARLGDGVETDGRMRPERMEAALALIGGYARTARYLGATALVPFCTAAVRDATNGEEFVANAAKAAGVEPRVITGDEEARWGFAGSSYVVGSGTEAAVLDVGGRSTELSWGRGREWLGGASCAVGSRSLKDRADLDNGPVSASQRRRMRRWALEELRPAHSAVGIEGSPALVGSGGTLCALACIEGCVTEYAPERLQGSVLERAAVERMLAFLAHRSEEERSLVVGLDSERADVIVPGAVIVSAAMEVLGAERLTIDTYGVRLGAILEGCNWGEDE